MVINNILRRVLFEKVQHTRDCEKQLLVTSFQEVKNIE